jgi:hypothetical protein
MFLWFLQGWCVREVPLGSPPSCSRKKNQPIERQGWPHVPLLCAWTVHVFKRTGMKRLLRRIGMNLYDQYGMHMLQRWLPKGLDTKTYRPLTSAFGFWKSKPSCWNCGSRRAWKIKIGCGSHCLSLLLRERLQCPWAPLDRSEKGARDFNGISSMYLHRASNNIFVALSLKHWKHNRTL